jgi:hypothetical protein
MLNSTTVCSQLNVDWRPLSRIGGSPSVRRGLLTVLPCLGPRTAGQAGPPPRRPGLPLRIQRPAIAVPRGASFDIGRVTPEDQAGIPLQTVRPLVLRAAFQGEEQFDDVLGLGKLVDEMLRSVSARGRDARLVFVDARDLPDAYRLAGRYRIQESKVTVSINLFQGKKKAAQFSVSGDKRKVADLVAKIIGETEKRLDKPVP